MNHHRRGCSGPAGIRADGTDLRGAAEVDPAMRSDEVSFTDQEERPAAPYEATPRRTGVQRYAAVPSPPTRPAVDERSNSSRGQTLSPESSPEPGVRGEGRPQVGI